MDITSGLEDVRACLFDVFGTVVNWRSSVARELRSVLEPRGVDLPWEELADDRRGRYQPAMESLRNGDRAFVPLDLLHRENLEAMMVQVPELSRLQEGSAALTEHDLAELNRAWHRLEPWPDSPAGLRAPRHFALPGSGMWR